MKNRQAGNGVIADNGINGSLRKREVQSLSPYTEHYLFNSAANLKAYSNNGLDFAYYGYNAANTRTYKLSMLNLTQWVNGQPQPLQLQLQNAMFYPNAYLTFNSNGNYTKHYYNGSERIASRLGSNTHPTDATSNDRLEYRMMRSEEKFRENIQELVSDGQPVDFQGTVNLNSLQPVNATSDIFYYHTNHLGSTAFVTDNNATVTQGFLYAPFGEITTEYTPLWQNGVLPNYTFNAKELDEESGMYYYEARYYQPPVFTSRDPMFEKYFWMTPYAYCANNPLKYVDPTGMDDYEVNRKTGEITLYKKTEDNFDRLVAQGKDGLIKLKRNGNYKSSIKVDKEFINSQQIGSFHDDTEAKIYKLSVAENKKGKGVDIFKFLSYNTEIEWGIASNGKESTICSGSSLHEWDGYHAALEYGENIEYYYHSHPGNDASSFPSTGEHEDVDCWNSIWNNNPNALMGILTWHSPIQLYRKCDNKKGYSPTR